LALCSNHHVAFDRHLIWVDPRSRQIELHPKVKDHEEPATSNFIASTLNRLREPTARVDSPRPEMFERRYDHFKRSYDWVAG
jgi:hypothetical protein